MKVIIAGSRTFGNNAIDKHQFRSVMDELGGWIDVVVSGTAKGADKMGERWAEENEIEVIRFPANWELYITKVLG